MLEKILRIDNIGRLVRYRARGDVEFRRLTLIYSENARGKTTLCGILRSLKTGDGVYIDERTTLGAADTPSVQIRLDGTSATYTEGEWDRQMPSLLIFDEQFVEDNIYSGCHVSHDQKRGLCRFAIGEEGVRLAQQIDEFDEQSRKTQTAIVASEQAIRPLIIGGMSVDEFCRQEVPDNIADQVNAKTTELESLKKAGEITAKAALSAVGLPEAPTDSATALLTKQLEDVSQEALAMVQSHLAEHLDEHGERWLSTGLAYLGDQQPCPFCGQATDGLALVKAYRQYFSETYAELKANVETKTEEVNRVLSDTVLLRVQEALQTNHTLSEYWGQHVTVTVPTVDADGLREAWLNLRKALVSHLGRKAASPLDRVAAGDDLAVAAEAYATVVAQVTAYNDVVTTVNERIAECKEQVAGGNLATVERQLTQLRNAAARANAAAIQLCVEYLQHKLKKAEIEAGKEATREQLDDHLAEVLPEYQEKINGHLEHFGADFRLHSTAGRYAGGRLSANYCLRINDTNVDLDAREPNPCFKNTLSAGDKNSLALALFLARLELDTGLPDKVVVFDDPMSSLDVHRKRRTIEKVLSMCQQTKQVVVLSHDAHFLRALWDSREAPPSNALEIVRSGEGSDIQQWDIEATTQGDFLSDYQVLTAFAETGEGDGRNVIRRIRPVLEGNLRVRFPGEFGEDDTLGTFLGKVNTAPEDSILKSLEPVYRELNAINDYTREHHHTRVHTGDETEAINNTELKQFVESALRLLPGT